MTRDDQTADASGRNGSRRRAAAYLLIGATGIALLYVGAPQQGATVSGSATPPVETASPSVAPALQWGEPVAQSDARTLTARPKANLFETPPKPAVRPLVVQTAPETQVVATPQAPRFPYAFHGEVSVGTEVWLALGKGTEIHLVTEGSVLEDFRLEQVGQEGFVAMHLPTLLGRAYRYDELAPPPAPVTAMSPSPRRPLAMVEPETRVVPVAPAPAVEPVRVPAVRNAASQRRQATRVSAGSSRR